jgi:hypothetical protein
MTTNPSKIKRDHIMSIVHYIKVTDIYPDTYEFNGDDIDQPTNQMKVKGKELLERAYSADQFDTEEKISKTHAAELLVTAVNRPFTVCFDKTDGSERTIRGRLVKPEPLLGRSMVEDLDAPSNNRLRQVDHRTIHWLVVEGKKYIVK